MRESKVNSTMNHGKSAYNIGMTSITEQDWEELMDSIDSCMEGARIINEQGNERDEESLERKIYNKLYMK